MTETSLTLAGLTFKDFEVPAGITFGGTQKLAVHQLLGGGRIVDTLGSNKTDISWKGIFTGNAAVSRIRYLDSVRAAGKPVSLSWNDFSYSVILASFEAEYIRPQWLPYKITCLVVDQSLLSDLFGNLGLTLQESLNEALTLAPDILPASLAATVRANALSTGPEAAAGTLNQAAGLLTDALQSSETFLSPALQNQTAEITAQKAVQILNNAQIASENSAKYHQALNHLQSARQKLLLTG